MVRGRVGRGCGGGKGSGFAAYRFGAASVAGRPLYGQVKMDLIARDRDADEFRSHWVAGKLPIARRSNIRPLKANPLRIRPGRSRTRWTFIIVHQRRGCHAEDDFCAQGGVLSSAPWIDRQLIDDGAPAASSSSSMVRPARRAVARRDLAHIDTCRSYDCRG